MVLCDFHPFTRLLSANGIECLNTTTVEADYFDNSIQRGDVAYKQYFPESERDSFPDCMGRRYTLSQMINACIQSGFVIREFNEHPGWVNTKRPGEFTIIALI